MCISYYFHHIIIGGTAMLIILILYMSNCHSLFPNLNQVYFHSFVLKFVFRLII